MDERPEGQNAVPQPELFIEGKPYRSDTFPLVMTSDGLPIIDKNDEKPLAELLRIHAVMGADNSGNGFWPFKLLCHILERKRILVELIKAYTAEDAERRLNIIRPVDFPLQDSNSQIYLRTFALLTLLEKVGDIGKFIKEDVSDQKLPVRKILRNGKVFLSHNDSPDSLSCFDEWKDHEREAFEAKQWQFLVPYFDLDTSDMAKHQNLESKTILPWCKTDDHLHSSSQPSGQQGGFGFVSRVKIDPSSHGFRNVLEKVGLKYECFALKMLQDRDFNNEKQFQNELEQLKRFNGLVHDHLVTLLATFTLDKRYYFLFPYADSTLEQFWESNKSPKRDLATAQWVSKQCLGIMAAIDSIHDPKHLQNLGVRRYGRHGDIKPDNILWFESSKDPRGILVVSDMGLSSFNRDTSRSNIPNTKIPKVPGYRPPECDIEGGTISRAYDIWTLGCLFLELLTWWLGGWELVEKFQEARKSVYITGAINNIFFDLKKVKGRNQYVAQVKIQVTKWFDELRSLEHCSEFVHEALDVIENRMLIVLSQGRMRALSPELRKKFEDIHSKCMNDKRRNYCLKGEPRLMPPTTREATAVAVRLNEVAKLAISEHNPDLPTFDPAEKREMRNSMWPEEYKKMDEAGE